MEASLNPFLIRSLGLAINSWDLQSSLRLNPFLIRSLGLAYDIYIDPEEIESLNPFLIRSLGLACMVLVLPKLYAVLIPS